MTFPNDSDISNLSREQVINILLASIGFEELALAQMVKSQTELLRRALEKCPCNDNKIGYPMVKSLDDLVKINASINETLKTITNKERILLAKLKEVIDLIGEVPVPGNFCSAAVETGEAVIKSAYINEETIGSVLKVGKINIHIAPNCPGEDNKIHIKLQVGNCEFLTISLVENTAKILCNQDLNRALIRATVNVEAANDQYDGVYKALISVDENGELTIFLENNLNRILFRISGTDTEVEKCGNGAQEPGNLCDCSVRITTNQNTDITITGDNVFDPGILSDFFLDIPCNCNSSNSSLDVVIREEFVQILIPGEFEEGTITTSCSANEASILGSVILGNVFYNVTIQANQNGTVTAIFVGASTFTVTLNGATVILGDCSNNL